MDTVTEIVNAMIEAQPDALRNGPKKPVLFISMDLYVRLKTELNRNVRTYKGYKVKPRQTMQPDRAVLTHKFNRYVDG
jgi:hypothetical protein